MAAPGPQLRSETTNLSWCRRRRDEARADPEGFAVCVALVLVTYLFILMVGGWLG